MNVLGTKENKIMKTSLKVVSVVLVSAFLDQKDLGKVIKIAENRIQKVLDERGGSS